MRKHILCFGIQRNHFTGIILVNGMEPESNWKTLFGLTFTASYSSWFYHWKMRREMKEILEKKIRFTSYGILNLCRSVFVASCEHAGQRPSETHKSPVIRLFNKRINAFQTECDSNHGMALDARIKSGKLAESLNLIWSRNWIQGFWRKPTYGHYRVKSGFWTNRRI